MMYVDIRRDAALTKLVTDIENAFPGATVRGGVNGLRKGSIKATIVMTFNWALAAGLVVAKRLNQIETAMKGLIDLVKANRSGMSVFEGLRHHLKGLPWDYQLMLKHYYKLDDLVSTFCLSARTRSQDVHGPLFESTMSVHQSPFILRTRSWWDSPQLWTTSSMTLRRSSLKTLRI